MAHGFGIDHWLTKSADRRARMEDELRALIADGDISLRCAAGVVWRTLLPLSPTLHETARSEKY
jgi:hypothetical protein